MSNSDDWTLVDAVGGGVARLSESQEISDCSAGFTELTGLDAGAGSIAERFDSLPALDQLSTTEGARVQRIGADGVQRELDASLVSLGGAVHIVLADRSGEARLRRDVGRLRRGLDDLHAELEAVRRGPPKPRVRSSRELAARLSEALARSSRYHHDLTVLAVEGLEPAEGQDPGVTVASCVRGVDDVGLGGENRWLVVLPHTDLPGGKVVADRIVKRLGSVVKQPPSVGAATARDKEDVAALVKRAEQALDQARDAGGGVLMAVEVL